MRFVLISCGKLRFDLFRQGRFDVARYDMTRIGLLW